MARRFGAGSVVLLLASTVWAADIELDDFVMEDIDMINESLASNVALRDAAAVARNAQELRELFAEVEQYFLQRGDATDAVDYARSAREAAVSIASAADAGQFETAANLASDLSRTCKSCHRKYRRDSK